MTVPTNNEDALLNESAEIISVGAVLRYPSASSRGRVFLALGDRIRDALEDVYADIGPTTDAPTLAANAARRIEEGVVGAILAARRPSVSGDNAEARAEAERRWPRGWDVEEGTFRDGSVNGFILGAEWLASQPREAAPSDTERRDLEYRLARHRVGPVGPNVRTAADVALAEELLNYRTSRLGQVEPAPSKIERPSRLELRRMSGEERADAILQYLADSLGELGYELDSDEDAVEFLQSVIAGFSRTSQPREAAPSDTDEWCRDEACEFRHWRSGSMPTHKHRLARRVPHTGPGHAAGDPGWCEGCSAELHAAEPVHVEVTDDMVDALDALPVGTVVGFVGGAAHREYAGSMLLWVSTDGGRDQYARTLAHRRGALTVLRRPAALGGGDHAE